MNAAWRRAMRLIAGAVLSVLVLSLTPPVPWSRSSPIAATSLRVVSVNPDSASITIVDRQTNTVEAEVFVGGTPQTVAIFGDFAYVATREGVVTIVDLEKRKVASTISVRSELFGVAATSSRLYLTAPGIARLLVYDRATLQRVGSVDLEPHPRGLAVSPSKILVTHFRTGRLSVIDVATLTIERVIATLGDSNLSQAVFVYGNRAYLPQTRSNASNPALLFDSTVFPIISAVDVNSWENQQRERISLDIVDRPVNMPLDMVIASDKAYVVNAGSDDVSVIDVARLQTVAHLEAGSNPRGIAVSPDHRTLYVNNTLSGTITVIDAATDRVTATITATRIPLPPHQLNGKILFHTSNRASLAKDRWISCATCHFDGGTDGRTWFFRDGPRNTTSLFGIQDTMPMHWSGDLDELEDVENTVRLIQAGSGLTAGGSHCEPRCDQAPPNRGRSSDLDDLAAFMRGLRPPPPAHEGGSDSVLRGRALFFDPRTGCAGCHPGPVYTDRLQHDVGTGRGPAERRGSSFDTPSLRGLFDTAPYFHDGSAATLLDVVKDANGQHGNTSGLTPGEIDDLIVFLRSLAFPSGRQRSVR